MKAARTEAGRWLRQAESDLAFAELGAREGFPAQACFTSQQAAEKALKAIHPIVAKKSRFCSDSGAGVQNGQSMTQVSFESCVTVH